MKKKKIQRPAKLSSHIVNDTGFLVESACRLPEIKFYEECGSVLFWASIMDREESDEIEALQYLDPFTAMKMAKQLEACAIQALRNKA